MERRLPLIERIPVRWRIAVTCAGLTLLILVAFAAVLGNVVGHRIRSDFDHQLHNAAGALAAETQVTINPILGQPVIRGPQLDDSAMAEGAVIRVVSPDGTPLAGATTDPSVDLGKPHSGVSTSGKFGVASASIPNAGPFPAFVQYAEPDDDVQATIDRLWLFLGLGVLAGTLLALLGGLAVADRAMRPIAGLTALARRITSTGDPSERMPVPAADDEVGELARTMDTMLESLDEAHTKREDAFERQRAFVADASHELRTPLTSVQANLELLQGSVKEGDDRHAVDSALGSAKRMSRLVADLSLLARADAGRRAARTEVDLSQTTHAALQEAAALSGSRPINSELDGPLTVNGNPDELHRLVLNLVENAVRHTPPRTRITVTARKDGKDALLEVADDGPGIPEGLHDQVFDRFVRGEGPADTAAGGGSGLGLAIVRAVAESHGGSVEARESEHGGALFVVRLPLAATGEPKKPKSKSSKKPESRTGV
jgi:two-component system OmpR family sensor kinase